MPYKTKNNTFHVIRVKVSTKSRCLRTLPMNVAIEGVWKAWSNMIKGRALYQSMRALTHLTYESNIILFDL